MHRLKGTERWEGREQLSCHLFAIGGESAAVYFGHYLFRATSSNRLPVFPRYPPLRRAWHKNRTTTTQAKMVAAEKRIGELVECLLLQQKAAAARGAQLWNGQRGASETPDS
jgi:hypothetical protein